MVQDLLYVEEHLSCRHYVSDYRCSFKLRTFEKDVEFDIENRPINMLLFFLEGDGMISCNEFKDKHFKAGEVAFIPKSAVSTIIPSSDIKALTCVFDVPNNICDKMHLQSYYKLCQKIEYNFQPVAIKPQMQSFLDSMAYYLEQGINCEHFHEIKQQEMFLILRWFYKKEELAQLLYPIIGQSLDFKALVLENYLRVENVSELAELANMGRSNFDIRFRKEFGMPAGKWMLNQTAKHVRHYLSKPGTTISDVMIKFNFNSPTHFTRFCKQQFGCTPTELIHQLQSA